MTERIAVVTGANKGIGLQIVRSLCLHFGNDAIVYLTARDKGRGLAALEQLKKEGLSPRFHPLDVTDVASIEKLRDHLMEKHDGLHILVNNAGLGFETAATVVMETNFYGVLDVSRALIPIMRPGGRVVHLTSTLASYDFKKLSKELKQRFRSVSTEQEIVSLMDEYIEVDLAFKTVIRLSLQCCPGCVMTDMTANLPDDAYGGKLSVEEGADTPVYLALLPPGRTCPQGQFLLRRQVYDFINNDIEIDARRQTKATMNFD